MGKDNQDYFKRAGRSGGPAGTFSQFKAALGQERASLRRDFSRRHPPPGLKQHLGEHPEGEEHEEAHQASTESEETPAGRRSANGSANGGDRGDEARSARASARESQADVDLDELPDEEDLADESETMGFGFPNREEAPFGFGVASTEAPLGEDQGAQAERRPNGGDGWDEPLRIPASEELATGIESAPFERDIRARHAQARRARPMGERMARRFRLPFRWMGAAAGAIDRPLRRVLTKLQSLGDAARRS